MNLEAARDVLREAVADELAEIGDRATASALQAVVSRGAGERKLDVACGAAQLAPRREPVTPKTRFDTASLTKVLVTAPLAMQAVDEKRWKWRAPITDYLDWWPDSGPKADVSVLQLLNHTSGLPDWLPVYEDLPFEPGPGEIDAARRKYAETIRDVDLAHPPGDDEIYSDLGYIALGFALEEIFGARLDELARRRIFEPLGLDRTGHAYSPDGTPTFSEAPATERQPGRADPVRGRVHDRNAAALGGVAGHAGTFSTARDITAYVEHLLAILDDAEDPLVSRESLEFCWSNRASGDVGHHRGGWDTPSGDESSAGRGFRAGSTVGHLGFTGTSIWVERDSAAVAVLLTNRVYPSRDNDRIHRLRVDFHEAVLPP